MTHLLADTGAATSAGSGFIIGLVVIVAVFFIFGKKKS